MDSVTLEEFGLTPNEAKVYLSLVRKGPSNASLVVSETGLHRVLVYDVLGRLVEKGLVGSVIKADTKLFEAASPKELVDWLDRKETELSDKRKRLQQIYPELMELFSNVKEKQGVFFFKGKRGVKAAMDKLFGLYLPVFGLGSSGRTREVLGSDFSWIRRHVEEKGIPVKMLYYEFAREKADIGFRKNCEVRFLPDEYRNPMMVDVSGHITVLLLLNEDPFAILIENQAVADSFKQYFNFLWQIAKE